MGITATASDKSLITAKIDQITKLDEKYLHSVLPAPKSVKIELSPRCNFRCLAGDTLVDTIYGRIPIKELSERFETVPVYTYRDGRVFIADAINIRKYGEGEKLVRVLFDDGSHIDCTPDHRFLQFKSLGAVAGTEEWPTAAEDLQSGSRVRAYRENTVGNGYTVICWGREFRRHRSRLVMDYLLGRRLTSAEQVHHNDHDIGNDHPDNLEYMASAREHTLRHPEIAARMRSDNPVRGMTPEWRRKINAALKGKKRTVEQRLRYRDSKLGAKNPNFIDGRDAGRSRIQEINHRVVSVTPLAERADTYCLDVPETGWFFANKVLVKNCGFCALRTRQNQPKEDMDLAFFKRITREMREAGVEEIGCFYLGESFMNPDLLIDAIRYLKRELAFPYVFLTSNASLATPDSVESCMEAGLDSLKWSVNAADHDQFTDVMGVKTKLMDNAMRNIRQAFHIREEGNYKTGLYASSIQYDESQKERMEEILKKVIPYVDQHYWLPLYSMGSLATQREKELGYRPTAGNQGRLDALREPLPCWSAFSEGHVTARGDLSACCFDADDRWSMGSLYENSFMEAWNCDKFVKLREAHLRKDVAGTVCEDCVAYS